MNEAPLSIWRRPWRGRAKVFAWFALLALAAFVAFCCVGLVTNASAPELILFALLGAIGLAGLVFAGLWGIRWLSCWRNLRRVLFGVACLATLLALTYAAENWRGKHAWQQYRREWEAKGEQFDFLALTPPLAPEEKNFALTPLLKPLLDFTREPSRVVWRDTNGLARLEALSADLGSTRRTNDLVLGNLEKGTFADVSASSEFYRGNTNYPQAAASATPAETILVALGRFAPELQELRAAAASRPECRFPIHYSEEPSWAILLPHLARMKGLTTLTRVQALAELEAGHSAAAFEDLRLGWRLSGSTRDEPFLISHLVRVATVAINLQTVREGLVRHAWTEAQLAELEASLSRLDLLAEYKSAMRGERALATRGLDYLRRQGFRDNPMAYLADENGGSSSSPPFNAMPGGWICQNMLAIARMHQDFLLPAVDERAHRVFPGITEAGKRAVGRMRVGPYTILARMLLPALENSVRKSARMQTYVDAAQVACALERYRLAGGKLPDALDALVPRFIPVVPNDVIDGKPLRYRLSSAAGYLLYSVGWNQTDDGGEIALNQQKQVEGGVDTTRGDWVWKMAGNSSSAN